VTAEIDKVEQVQKMNLHFEKINQVIIHEEEGTWVNMVHANFF
jgi:hypothetical protein